MDFIHLGLQRSEAKFVTLLFLMLEQLASVNEMKTSALLAAQTFKFSLVCLKYYYDTSAFVNG